MSHSIVGNEDQRQAFSALMPYLRMLRNKGFSFQQITALLGQCGFRLQPSMVRTYFSEMLTDYQDEHMRQVNELLILLSAMANATAGHQKDEQDPQTLPEPVDNSVCVVPDAPEYPLEGLDNSLRCLPLQTGVKPLARREGVPESVYSDCLMEHPDITGLMLSREERLYGALLEIDEKGKVRTETVQEKVFRVKWKKPIPRTATATGKDFVKMDHELFKYVGKAKPPGYGKD